MMTGSDKNWVRWAACQTEIPWLQGAVDRDGRCQFLVFRQMNVIRRNLIRRWSGFSDKARPV